MLVGYTCSIHVNISSFCFSLKETFDAFEDRDEIDKGVLESVESLKELKLEMKHSIALWKMAVQMKRGLAG